MLAMLIPMLAILMLILMLINLNTGYADTDADLCIRIMSLCCNTTRFSCLLTQTMDTHVLFILSRIVHLEKNIITYRKKITEYKASQM